MLGNKIHKERSFLTDSDINWLISVTDYLVKAVKSSDSVNQALNPNLLRSYYEHSVCLVTALVE